MIHVLLLRTTTMSNSRECYSFALLRLSVLAPDRISLSGSAKLAREKSSGASLITLVGTEDIGVTHH